MSQVFRKEDTTSETEATLALGSYLAASAQLKDYLRQLLAEYEPYLTPLSQLRQELNRQLKGQSLSQLVRQMRGTAVNRSR